MIVYNTGYLKKEDVIALHEKGVKFGIFKTYKGTCILVKYKYKIYNIEYLYLPQFDRLPYKVIEGKKITHGSLVFDSTQDDIDMLDTKDWNNENQIISYEDYYLSN
jgi:hypothetical protein